MTAEEVKTINKFMSTYAYSEGWLEFEDFDDIEITEQGNGTFLVNCVGFASYTVKVRSEDDWDEKFAEMEATFLITLEEGMVVEVEAKSKTFYNLPEDF